MDSSTSALITNQETVKSKILKLLIHDYNLRPKQIHIRLTKEGVRSSYQATYKALMEMLDDKILEKNDYGFRISLMWVNNLKNFIKDIEIHYSTDNDPLKKIIHSSSADGCFLLTHFKSIKEMDEFLFSFISYDEGFLAFVKHPWFPLIHSKEIASYSSKQKIEKTVIFSNSTSLDKDCRRFFKKLGEKTPVCENFMPNQSFSIYGNYIVQAFFERELMKYLDKVFENTKKISDLDLVEFNKNFFEKQTTITTITIYNSILAQTLREWASKNGK